MSINQAGVYALSTLLPTIATTTAIARLRVRILQKASFRIEDWTACIGGILMWAVAFIIIAGTAQNLFGFHTIQDSETGESVLTPNDRKNVKYMMLVMILNIPAIGAIKLSIVCLYRHIFNISRAFKIYTTILLILIIGWILAFFFALVFQCGTHPTAAWTSAKMIKKYCTRTEDAQAALALSDLVMDLMIVLAPMPIVWKLKMTVAQKVQVTGIFAFGFLAAASSAVRCYILLYDSYFTTLSYRDIQGENTKVVAWSLIEIVAALIGCNLPTLRPLLANTSFGNFLGSLFSVVGRSRRRSYADEKDLKKVKAIGGEGGRNVMVKEMGSEDSNLVGGDSGRVV